MYVNICNLLLAIYLTDQYIY